MATALPVLVAILVEYPFYLVPAFPEIRKRWSGRRLAIYFLASSVVPYLICCFGAVQFDWTAVVRLAALAGAIGLWYVVLPVRPIVDLLFLAFTAGVLLFKYLEPIYPAPMRGLDIVILGHLALIQMAVMELLLVRRAADPGYGFIPKRAEWGIGALHFVYFAAVGFPLALLLRATHVVSPAPIWKVAATFLGFLWVVSLSEEFFFRGILQQWIEDWTGRRNFALVTASFAFGLVHLGFRGFPNWRWALIAAVLGYFCGRARNRAGSIRAGMVTHALTIAAWRAFFW